MNRIFWSSLLCLFLVPALGGPVMAETVMTIPEKAYIGQPFFAEIFSDEEMASAVFSWRGRQLTPPIIRGENGWTSRVLLGTDVKYAAPGDMTVTAEVKGGGNKKTLTRAVSLYSKAFPEERLTVSAGMVNPPAESLKRIREEAKLVGKALGAFSPEQYWSGPFTRPVPGAVSSGYGLKRFFNNQPKSPHRGLDMNAAKGEPVFAMDAGRVVLAGDHYYAGKSVYIDHGLGLVSVYFHLSEILVAEGGVVEKSRKIGLVGATGRVTAPHLHFGVYILKHAVNPEPLFMEEFFQTSAEKTP